jgi:hypothetical protein
MLGADRKTVVPLRTEHDAASDTLPGAIAILAQRAELLQCVLSR